MDWTLWLIFAVVLIGFLVLRRMSFVSAEKARQLMRAGARVVDVRNPGEFNAGHLPDAINIPLGELNDGIQHRFPDKNQVLLLHCLSGTRSGMARRQLKSLGYKNVFNLGSYSRAEQIMRAGRHE